MDKLNVFRPSHLEQAVPAHIWILMQGYISAPLSLFRAFRSWCLSSSHRLGHRAHPHRHRPLYKIQLMITPRFGEVPVETLPRRAASSSWWPLLGDLRRTAPAVIPPSGDQKRPMLRRPMMGWFRIWIQTSTPFGSRRSWSPFSGSHLKAPPCCSSLARAWGGELHRSVAIGWQPSRGTIRRQPIKRLGKESPKWNISIGKRQLPSSR
jgi:hypothetical protein